MTERLYIDTETYSETPITSGTYRYVESCELMIVTWALGDDEVLLWDATEQPRPPLALVHALRTADEVWAHNAIFDRQVIAKHLPSYAPALERWRCMMVRALAHGLPGSLDKISDILKLGADEAKIKEGRALVQLFCKPRPVKQKLRRATRLTHPEKWAQFKEYAKQDIAAMRAADRKLPEWNYGLQSAAGAQEIALYHLDQRINDRGFACDLPLVESALAAIDREQSRLTQQAQDLTDGIVQRATQRDAMLDYLLEAHGLFLPDLKGTTVERALESEGLDEGLRELLRVRLQASTSSTSKYNRIQNGVVNGRMRGTLQMNGAGRTARWAGRIFQPQNLPRYDIAVVATHLRISPREVTEHHVEQYLDEGICALKQGRAHLLFDNVMALCANTLRGIIVAPPSKKLCVADLSNIEGRDQAWLAGETWKLQAFRDYDAGNGPDLYKLAYSKSFGITPDEVTKSQRQVGKVQELALGYQGRIGAFVTFCVAYAIDIEQMARDALPWIPEDTLRAAGEFYDWWINKRKGNTFGLSRQAFTVCDSFTRLWREAHPNISALWRELEDAAVLAVESPGRTVRCRKFIVRRDGAWLRLQLPSGRALCYPHPRVDDKGKLSYMGINQFSRKWQRLNTYGGKLFENACQAVARDVMAANMPRIEEAGYSIVLTVHDEVISESLDEARRNADELGALLATPPAWAPDIPLAASGFEAYRYRKD